jgi:hypothetical protein
LILQEDDDAPEEEEEVSEGEVEDTKEETEIIASKRPTSAHRRKARRD